jgi:hypothetical protein
MQKVITNTLIVSSVRGSLQRFHDLQNHLIMVNAYQSQIAPPVIASLRRSNINSNVIPDLIGNPIKYQPLEQGFPQNYHTYLATALEQRINQNCHSEEYQRRENPVGLMGNPHG